jgi:hypothetical protein
VLVGAEWRERLEPFWRHATMIILIFLQLGGIA